MRNFGRKEPAIRSLEELAFLCDLLYFSFQFLHLFGKLVVA